MTRYSRKSSIESAPMGPEAVLYDPDAKRFCQLNATAACVWETLERPSTESEITGALRSRFSVPQSAQVEADVAAAIRQLVDLQMIQAAPESQGV